MAQVDPKRNLSLDCLQAQIQDHARVYDIYSNQVGSGREEVASWSMEEYLDVMETFHIVKRIKAPEEKWGDLLVQMVLQDLSC